MLFMFKGILSLYQMNIRGRVVENVGHMAAENVNFAIHKTSLQKATQCVCQAASPTNFQLSFLYLTSIVW